MRLYVTVSNNDPKDWCSVGDSWSIQEGALLDDLIDEIIDRTASWIKTLDTETSTPAAMILLRLTHETADRLYGISYVITRAEWDSYVILKDYLIHVIRERTLDLQIAEKSDEE